MIASIDLIRMMSAELRDTELSPARASELADDFNRIVGASRAVAQHNDFNDEPGKYLVALDQLARAAGEGQ